MSESISKAFPLKMHNSQQWNYRINLILTSWVRICCVMCLHQNCFVSNFVRSNVRNNVEEQSSCIIFIVSIIYEWTPRHFYFVNAHTAGTVLGYCRHEGSELLQHSDPLTLTRMALKSRKTYEDIFNTKLIIQILVWITNTPYLHLISLIKVFSSLLCNKN